MPRFLRLESGHRTSLRLAIPWAFALILPGPTQELVRLWRGLQGVHLELMRALKIKLCAYGN